MPADTLDHTSASAPRSSSSPTDSASTSPLQGAKATPPRAPCPRSKPAACGPTLYRRDFTINTLAVSLQGDHFGRLIDYFGGLRDIRNRRIRVMHSLSFIDDPTRVLRAIRFANRHGFRITEGTTELIETAVAQGMLRKISGKRIHTELTLLYDDPRPLHATELLDRFGVLESLHKRIKLDRFTGQLIRKIDATLNWFSLSYLRGKPRPILLYYMALMEKLKSAERRSLCRRLQLPAEITDVLTEFKQHIRRTLTLFTKEGRTPPFTDRRQLRSHAPGNVALHPRLRQPRGNPPRSPPTT